MLNFRLKEIRIKYGLSISQVSSLLNISQNCYEHYEANPLTLPIDILSRLCNIYGVSADFLIGRELKNKCK